MFFIFLLCYCEAIVSFFILHIFYVIFSIAPPTYEQAMFMTTDIADTDANTVSEASRFTPRYPVFDVDTFQSPPPNPPQKKRRRRRRRPADPGQSKQQPEKQPVESPVQIWGQLSRKITTISYLGSIYFFYGSPVYLPKCLLYMYVYRNDKQPRI